MSFNASKEQYSLEDLKQIVEILRSENGCPWDREQTHKTMVQPLLEETYETVEAINNEDQDNLKEELGDLLLQVVMNSRIAEEESNFNFEDVADGIAKKLILRHPHVFGDTEVKDTKEVLSNWEEIKKKEKNEKSLTESIEKVPKALPALLRAAKIQKKVSRVGFDWKEPLEAFQKLEEEVQELKVEIEKYEKMDTKNKNKNLIMEEYGDLLFSMVNLSRFFEINAEIALTNAIEKFINRFRYIEYFAKESDNQLEHMSIDEMNRLWSKAKSCTKG